jgi:hypothetical protein
MDVRVLSAIRGSEDLTLELPCGVFMDIPGKVLQDWAVTPATPDLMASASAAMGAVGQSLKGDAATPILEIIMQLLPTLLPICIPLITNSITKPANGPIVGFPGPTVPV